MSPDLGPDFHKRVAAAVHRDMAEVRRKAASVSGNLFEALALKFALAGGGLAAALAVCARFSSAALDAQIVRSALSGSSLFYYFS